MSRTEPARPCDRAMRLPLAVLAFGLGTIPAPAIPLRLPLSCTFKTVQAGQFHGLDFAASPIGGTIALTITASPLDLRLGRAAIIEDDRVQVAGLNAGVQQTTLIGSDARSTTVLSLFTSGSKDAAIPAAISRHELIGSIPVLVQSVGSCAPT